jgi:CheY-like chemotaxis protein
MASGDNDVVVVVEDEEEARTFLIQILEFEGFDVVGFSNGAEALDYLAHALKPCLIVLDMRMPIMDGPQFRTAMLQDSRLADIPVVIVTALEPSVAAGLSPLRIFRKPVDVSALLDVIRANC